MSCGILIWKRSSLKGGNSRFRKIIRQDSLGTWLKVPGQPPSPVSAWSYHVVVDSKGVVWFSQLILGDIVSLDPRTGKTKEYKPSRRSQR